MGRLTSNLYFLVRWLCLGIVRSFFKDVAILHPERIPLYGPAIFVGNHNNQFMDASMLVANIPRQVHFLVALKSMKRHVIGFLCRLSGCIPVDRQDDRAFTGQGAARISHHFTEEDHICPQPPHHHHHQRHHHNHYETSQPRTERLSSREDVRSRHNLGRSDSALADQGLKDLHSGKSEDHPSGLMITTPSHSHRNGNGEAGGGGEGNSSSSSSVGTTPGRISGSRTPVDANEKQDGEGKHEVRKEGSQGTISRTKEDDRDEGIHETHSRLSSDNHHKYKSSVGSPEGHLDREKEDHEKLPLTSTSALSQRGQSIPTTWPHDEKSEGTKPGEREGDSRSVSFPRDLPVHGPGNSVSEGAIAVGGQMTSTTPGLSPSVAMRSEGTSPFTRIGDREGRYHHHPSNVHSNGSSHIREGFQLRTMASSASSTSIQMSISILGEGTKFTCDVRPGHKIRLEGKDYTVLKVFSDTHLLAKPPSDMPIRTIGSSPVPTAPVSRCTSVPRVGSEPLIAGAWTDKERTPMLGKMIRAESARETGRILRHHAGGLVAGQLSIGETRRKKRGGGGEEDDDESSGSTSGGGWRPTDREASFSSKSSSSCGSSASFTYNTSGRQSQSYEGDGNVTGGDKLSADGRRQEDEEEEENTKAQQETQRGNGNEAGDLVKSEASKMEREEEEEHQEEKEDQGRVEGDKQQQRDEGTKLHSVIGERRAKDEELPRGIGELGEEGLRRRKGGEKKDGREDVQEEERKEDGEVVKRGDAKGWARGGEERRDDSTRALHRHHHHHDHHKRRAHEKQRRSSIVSYHPYKILPKVDQREVYEAVSQSLVEGDCIGIFPEGGSHDRTTLLPLKAGVAIMALQGLAAGAEDVMIVPVGLIYHNPHKTQSRATIHIGDPIPVSRELAIEYQHDRRAATSRILTDVEKGLRSCIITAQDHETMSLIRLCCSLYPPERLRLSPEKFFNLNQLISKLFWRCADELDLLKLRKDLAAYQGALQRAGVPDHDVWMLKQSTAGASLIFSEKLIAFLYACALGLPLLPLWGPLRVIAYILAERHRAKALAASAVKLKATDVVASYKMIVLLVCVPLFNLIYGALFGLIFRKSLWETFVSMVLCVCLLPVLYYISMRRAERILPLLRQMRTLILVVIGKVNIWRENERELITQRMELQFLVRETLFTLGPRTSATFMDELYAIVPKAVLHADINRLLRKKEDFAPLQMKSLMNNAEEIL